MSLGRGVRRTDRNRSYTTGVWALQEALSIRKCGQEEAQSLLTLWRKAGATVGVTDTIEDIQRVISNSAAIVLVAERDGLIVGSVIGTFDGWRIA